MHAPMDMVRVGLARAGVSDNCIIFGICYGMTGTERVFSFTLSVKVGRQSK